MNKIKSELLIGLQQIESKINQNLELTEEEIQTLLLSSLWSEESHESS